MTGISRKWYATPAVAKALRSETLKIEFIGNDSGCDNHAVTNTKAYRVIYKAYDLAVKGGRIAENFGAEWARVEDVLGLRVTPMMLVAAKIGAPYEWQHSPQYGHATVALAEIG